MAVPSEIEKLERRWLDNVKGLTFVPLAEAYRKAGRFDEAFQALEIGLQNHPEYVPAHIVRGRCCLDVADDAQAEEAFSTVLNLDPENIIALKGLADIHERTDQPERAAEALGRLLDFDPTNDEASARLARIQDGLRAAVDQGPPPLDPGSVDLPSAEAVAPEATLSVEATPAETAPEDESEERSEDPAGGVLRADEITGPLETFEPLDLSPAGRGEFSLPNDSEMLVSREDAAEFAPESEDLVVGSDDPPWPEETLAAAPEENPADSEFVSGSDEPDAEMREDPVEVTEPIEVVQPEPADLPGAEGEGSEPAMAQSTIDEPPVIREVEDIFGDALAEESGDGPEAEDVVEDEPAETMPAESELVDDARSEDSFEMSEPPLATDTMAEEATTSPVADEEPIPAIDENEDTSTDPSIPEPVTQDAEAAPEMVSEHPVTGGDQSDTDEDVPEERDPGDAELVMTETMAELFLRQGHREMALAIYTQLAREAPDDSRLQEKVESLRIDVLGDRVETGEPEPVPETQRPAYDAATTGGESVGAFLRSVLAMRERPSRMSVTPPAIERGGPAGEPTRPSGETFSLSAVFGEEPSPVPPVGSPIGARSAATGPDHEGGEEAPSFDEFFGETAPSVAQGRAGIGTEADDLEQFNEWLKGLMR